MIFSWRQNATVTSSVQSSFKTISIIRRESWTEITRPWLVRMNTADVLRTPEYLQEKVREDTGKVMQNFGAGNGCCNLNHETGFEWLKSNELISELHKSERRPMFTPGKRCVETTEYFIDKRKKKCPNNKNEDNRPNTVYTGCSS